MEMNKAKTILNANGIMADQTTVRKNGRELDALTIGSGSVKPTLYEENLVNLHNEEEMMEFVHRVLDQTPTYDVKDLFTREDKEYNDFYDMTFNDMLLDYYEHKE